MLMLVSCEKENLLLPDNLVAFPSTELGIGADEEEITVTLNFSRALTEATTVSVQVTPQDVVYGTDFITDPETVGSLMPIVLEAGATEASFTLSKVPGALFDGDEAVLFELASIDGELISGEKSSLIIRFAEITASSGSMELQGGGALYPNKVFVDFSGNRQTAVARNTWDLGFSSEPDFRVILNTSNGTMVRVLNKTDLNAVTAADTVGFGQQMSMAAVFAAITSPSPPAWVNTAIEWIDDPTGNLNNTAIDVVSATAGDNKVYIINRGTGPGTPAPNLGWKKFRIVRNGDHYTIQHADIGATSFTETTIIKDSDLRFTYFQFDTGVVSVEPSKTRWDIAWSGFSNSTYFGTGPVRDFFQDVVLQNGHEVQTAKVMTATIAYDAFAETDIAGLTFSTSQIGIGTDWRSGGGPGVPPAVRTDRYYIVKDADGNYYKVRFTAITTGGERGKPQLEFVLVKAGS